MVRLFWNLEFKTRKKTRARRPDVILEDKDGKNIYIIDMSCPMQSNIGIKRENKLTSI